MKAEYTDDRAIGPSRRCVCRDEIERQSRAKVSRRRCDSIRYDDDDVVPADVPS